MFTLYVILDNSPLAPQLIAFGLLLILTAFNRGNRVWIPLLLDTLFITATMDVEVLLRTDAAKAAVPMDDCLCRTRDTRR